MPTHTPTPAPSSALPTPDTSTFHKQKHIKYWLRCLKTHLPTAYTSNDAVRMTLAFFILSALDLLGALHNHTTPLERAEYAEWILRCQHPDGGFRGFTGTMTGGDGQQYCSVWDSANLAATYFALAALAVLRTGIERVRRRECLEWVRRLQRGNGSFGEGLGKGGHIEGEWPGDVRFCYFAAGVRWFLRRGGGDGVRDVDVEGLAEFVQGSVTYEGGIAQSPFCEAHAGLTYSGLGALALLGRLPRKGSTSADKTMSLEFVEKLTKWLVSRQTLMLLEDEDIPMAEDDGPDPTPIVFPPTFHVQGAFPVSAVEASHHPLDASIEVSPAEMQWVGVNGRCNKVADTCYSYWVGGSLGILNKVYLQDFNGIRRYLLEKSQHMIGGFGKLPGDLPDILHSYLGLANLAVMREPDLKSIDPTLCISISAREDFEQSMAAEKAEGVVHNSNGA